LSNPLFLRSMLLRKNFAVNLKRARLARGLSQELLAELADLDRTYISLLENQRYAVSIDTLERLAIVLEVSASELLASTSS
jgi:transcriptional regulator with XRE-family HTH domain